MAKKSMAHGLQFRQIRAPKDAVEYFLNGEKIGAEEIQRDSVISSCIFIKRPRVGYHK